MLNYLTKLKTRYFSLFILSLNVQQCTMAIRILLFIFRILRIFMFLFCLCAKMHKRQAGLMDYS